MEVTIDTARAGLPDDLVEDIKRLAPRQLVSHNVERQLALRLGDPDDPYLATGDLVVHRDKDEIDPKILLEVHSAGSMHRSITLRGTKTRYTTYDVEDFIVFDLVGVQEDDDEEEVPEWAL